VVLATEALFHDDLAQQLVVLPLLLLIERRLQVRGREIALGDQQIPEASGGEGGSVHGRENKVEGVRSKEEGGRRKDETVVRGFMDPNRIAWFRIA
jgi:hypothetical protein